MAKRNGAALVIINREPTDFDDLADLVVRQDIGDALAPFVEPIRIANDVHRRDAQAHFYLFHRALGVIFDCRDSSKRPEEAPKRRRTASWRRTGLNKKCP